MKKVKTLTLKLTIIMAFTIVSLTGCGNNSTSTSKKPALPIKAYSTSISSSTSSDSEPTSTTNSKGETNSNYDKLLFKAKNNVLDDVKLNVVSVGSNNIDITNCSVSGFIKKTGLNYRTKKIAAFDSTDCFSDYSFHGKGFSLAKVPTIVYLEAVQGTQLVKTFKPSKFDNYSIKGIAVAKDATKAGDESFVLFNGNIHIGMTEKQIEDVYGKGFKYKGDPTNTCYYKNAAATMIVSYEKGVVEDITLLRNK